MQNFIEPNGQPWAFDPDVKAINTAGVWSFETAAGVPMPNVPTTLKPYTPAGPTLAEKQAVMWEKIKTERTRRENGGVLVTVTAAVGATPAVTKWFHTDIPSRCKYLGGADQGANLAPNLQWKTMDGTFVTMTPALITAIINAVADTDRANFTNAETHKTNMLAAADPTAYNYSTGWTAIYA